MAAATVALVGLLALWSPAVLGQSGIFQPCSSPYDCLSLTCESGINECYGSSGRLKQPGMPCSGDGTTPGFGILAI